jgi:hypothetical protein
MVANPSAKEDPCCATGHLGPWHCDFFATVPVFLSELRVIARKRAVATV